MVGHPEVDNHPPERAKVQFDFQRGLALRFGVIGCFAIDRDTLCPIRLTIAMRKTTSVKPNVAEPGTPAPRPDVTAVLTKNAQPAEPTGRLGVTAILVYAPAVFAGALLLFMVQPLVGKYILPWFGGSPEVWTTCMLLFQVLLLGGYAYAHFSVSRLSPRTQAVLHMALLGAALFLLPIAPSDSLKPDGSMNPTLAVLLILTTCLGLPYFVLSATGPLLQGWFCRTNPGVSPYRLYALSNAGSLIALLSYPFVVEPWLSRQQQANVWSIAMGGFAVLCAVCAVNLWLRGRTGKTEALAPDGADNQASSPPLGVRLLWLALPAAASVQLLAITNTICQDVAAIPFLWVVPLSIYLLSFIICFHHARWYVRPVFLALFGLAMLAVLLAYVYSASLSAVQQIWIYSFVLFACCMVCHGELFRIRPHPKHLTGYYLMIASGGAIGGFFVAIIAPLIFDSYRELYVGLLACVLFVLLADQSPKLCQSRRKPLWSIAILIVGSLAIFMGTPNPDPGAIFGGSHRDFFGMVTIWEHDVDNPEQHRFVMEHGSTMHGIQFVDPVKQLAPTAYYGPASGAGLTLANFRAESGRKIGVIGLGIGTLASYGRAGDEILFYEINPTVEQIAHNKFTYLRNSKADIKIALGDARLVMESQADQQFDILVIDAFNSDSVPVHLLTLEAMETYLRHLKPGGVIAAHLSARHLDLLPVVWRVADHYGLHTAWIEDADDKDRAILSSDWLLLSRDADFLNSPIIADKTNPRRDGIDRYTLWTDDRVNLFEILR